MAISVQNNLRINLNDSISIESNEDNSELLFRLSPNARDAQSGEPLVSLDDSDVEDLIGALQSWLDEK
jgi:hypothetical protein